MTWVRLTKSYVLNNKKRPIGKCVKVTTGKANEMVSEGVGFIYTGPIPPQKLKTEFFKPK